MVKSSRIDSIKRDWFSWVFWHLRKVIVMSAWSSSSTDIRCTLPSLSEILGKSSVDCCVYRRLYGVDGSFWYAAAPTCSQRSCVQSQKHAHVPRWVCARCPLALMAPVDHFPLHMSQWFAPKRMSSPWWAFIGTNSSPLSRVGMCDTPFKVTIVPIL